MPMRSRSQDISSFGTCSCALAGAMLLGVLAARAGADGTGPSIYISDPEGNTVELKGPPG